MLFTNVSDEASVWDWKIRTGPPVNFGRTLAHFIQSSLRHKHRHDLFVDVDEQHQEHEQCPKLTLDSLNRVVGVVTEPKVKRLKILISSTRQ